MEHYRQLFATADTAEARAEALRRLGNLKPRRPNSERLNRSHLRWTLQWAEAITLYHAAQGLPDYVAQRPGALSAGARL